MTIVQITAGAGKMYCGACFRDNALTLALRQRGHNVIMTPLYLPASFEEEDQSSGTPIFFSGINVYLEQKFPLFAKAPHWLHRLLASPGLLRRVANAAVKTNPRSLGKLTISMLQGEEGRQARELDELVAWLKDQKPDLISLSNALLVGLARQLKKELRIPVVCSLQGEDFFLDLLPEPDRRQAWNILSQRAAEIDLFIAPSHYFGDLIRRRLSLAYSQVKVIYNGINLAGYEPNPTPPSVPTLGYFARMSREKGLDTLAEAYVLLKKRVKEARLKIGGYCASSDIHFVNKIKTRLEKADVLSDVEFHPNLTRSQKQTFLRSLTVFSVPATYGEAFGLYILEALACGIPVVQPEHAAFPELITATGGGILCAPNDPASLAQALEKILQDPAHARALGEKGRQSIIQNFSIEKMAEQVEHIFKMF